MKVSKDFRPQPGDRFFSKFFESKGTVTEYKSPKNWKFILDNSTRVMKAKSNPWELDWIYINAIKGV